MTSHERPLDRDTSPLDAAGGHTTNQERPLDRDTSSLGAAGGRMTAALAEPRSAEADAATGRRAVLALARVEARRLLRHPLTIGAILFLLGLWVSAWFTNQANHYPVLQDVDRDSDLGMMLLLGAAALVAGNLAVLRAHRDGTTGLGRVLILPERSRTLAHLLAVLPLAALGAALILVRVAVLATLTPAAGHPNPYELATGPATVLLLGALGVLLARLTRSPVAAPLALLAVLASLVVLPLLTSGGSGQWLQPVVPQGDPMPVPASLMVRPAAAHLGYLLGLSGLLAACAVLRAGTRSTRAALAGVAALACTVGCAAWQAGPPGAALVAARTEAMSHPSAHQTCRRLDQVTYCAFAGFTGWIPAWNGVVQPVLARVPAAAHPPALTVRQRLVFPGRDGSVPEDSTVGAWQRDDAAAGTPAAVSAGTRWGDSRSAADLAALVAYRLVTGEAIGRDPLLCGGPGVLVVWLAGQATTQTGTGLHKLATDQGGAGGVSFRQAGGLLPGVEVPQPELSVALQALARPTADIAGRVQQHWATLRAPGTTAQQAAQILGVPAPPATAAQGDESGRRCR